jgi:hypothetical protein
VGYVLGLKHRVVDVEPTKVGDNLAGHGKE